MVSPQERELEGKIRDLHTRMKAGEMTYPEFEVSASALLAEASVAGMSVQAEADAVYRATDGQEPYITTTRDGSKVKVYGRPEVPLLPLEPLNRARYAGPDGRDGEVTHIQGVRAVRGARTYPQGFTPSGGSGGFRP